MSVGAAVSRLQKLAAAFRDEERPAFRPPSDLAALEELRHAVGGHLPSEFEEFLRQHDAIIAMDVHNGYWIGGAVDLARSTHHQHFATQVWKNNVALPVVPIATDGGGNAFLLAIQDGDVWRWNHESGAVTRVADSFVAFLNRVAEDWLHAAARDTAWSYLV